MSGCPAPDCTVTTRYDGSVCTTCLSYAGRPPSTTETASLGWNAGGNSVTELDGDVKMTCPFPEQCIGIVIGFKRTREFQTVPYSIEYGWEFTKNYGVNVAVPVELGVRKTAVISPLDTDTFYITRFRGVVWYWKNDEIAYVSKVPSDGVLIVNACMYATGDTLA